MSDYLPRPEGITEQEWQYFLNSSTTQVNPEVRDKVKAAMNTPEYKAIAIQKTEEHFTKVLEERRKNDSHD